MVRALRGSGDMRGQPFLILIMLATAASPALARPLLSNSQQSYTAACLADEESRDRMVGICEAALEDSGGTDAQRTEILVALADALYSVDKDDRASAVFQEVLERDPTNTDALNGLGWIEHDADKMDAAADLFDRSLSIQPSAQSLAGKASALRRGAGIDEAEFIVLMDTALAISPDYLWAMREKAWGQLAFGDVSEAEETARAVLKKDSSDVYSLYLLGYVLNERNRWKEAYQHLNEAAQIEGAPTMVFSQRSLASLNNGYYKLALADADRVIEGWPESSTGYVRRARALAALGRRGDAIEELTQFLKKDHNDFAAYWLAEFYFDDGKSSEAAASLERTMTLGKPDYYDHELLALIRLDLGEYQAALKHIDVAKELEPGSSFPYYYHALVLLAGANYDDADALMADAVERGLPENSVRSYIRDLASKGEFIRAIRMRLELNASD